MADVRQILAQAVAHAPDHDQRRAAMILAVLSGLKTAGESVTNIIQFLQSQELMGLRKKEHEWDKAKFKQWERQVGAENAQARLMDEVARLEAGGMSHADAVNKARRLIVENETPGVASGFAQGALKEEEAEETVKASRFSLETATKNEKGKEALAKILERVNREGIPFEKAYEIEKAAWKGEWPIGAMAEALQAERRTQALTPAEAFQNKQYKDITDRANDPKKLAAYASMEYSSRLNEIMGKGQVTVPSPQMKTEAAFEALKAAQQVVDQAGVDTVWGGEGGKDKKRTREMAKTFIDSLNPDLKTVLRSAAFTSAVGEFKGMDSKQIAQEINNRLDLEKAGMPGLASNLHYAALLDDKGELDRQAMLENAAPAMTPIQSATKAEDVALPGQRDPWAEAQAAFTKLQLGPKPEAPGVWDQLKAGMAGQPPTYTLPGQPSQFQAPPVPWTPEVAQRGEAINQMFGPPQFRKPVRWGTGMAPDTTPLMSVGGQNYTDQAQAQAALQQLYQALQDPKAFQGLYMDQYQKQLQGELLKKFLLQRQQAGY